MSLITDFIKKRVGSATYDIWEERIRRRLLPGSQSAKAAKYWADLSDCENYFNDPIGRVRSEWIADQVKPLGITSMLEIGTNSGRNLAIVRESYPDMPLRGTDVNARSIEYAKEKSPSIDFVVVDVNHWSEADKSVDAIITMSLIDHIPDEAMDALAKNMVRTAKKYIICFELWDGTDGWRGLYKYSRDLRKVFEPLGVKTIVHEPSAGQYNSTQSLLYTYIGEVPGAAEFHAADTGTMNRVVRVGGKSYPIEAHTDSEGRAFHYVHISRPETKKLLVHFTAFFGDWGDRKEYREFYQGYFHRLRMFGDVEEYSSLFLCDEYGHTNNGTYYTGKDGDFFVERAMEDIIETVMAKDGVAADQVVMAGSSMGATGALKFGLRFNVKSVVAISPHIDLDTCAKLQGRMEHVRYIVPDEDPISRKNYRYTRQVSTAVADSDGPLPHLFIHAFADDIGVYDEQVIPLANLWRGKGGVVDLDIRKDGGHTSEFATRPLLLDVVAKLFAGERIEPLVYRQKQKFWPKVAAAEVVEAIPRSDTSIVLAQVLPSNAETIALAADLLVERVRKATGTLPVLVFNGAVDQTLVDAVRRDPTKEGVEAISLGTAPVTGPAVLVLTYAFYGISRDGAKALLSGLPRFDAILVIDQTDNADGTESSLMTLRDSGGREYAAECHDFRNLFRSAGYANLLVQPLPLPSKSVSGMIVIDAHSQIPNDALVNHWRQQQAFDIRRYRGTQAGQFVIPSCSAGRVRIRAFLRNNHRLGEAFPLELRKLGLAVELRVFRSGWLIYQDPLFATIPLDGVVEISEKTCPVLAGDQTGILVVARCYLPSDGATYFGQEHQLCYVHEESGAVCSVLYDQLPVVTEGRDFSPIVLVAPKAWIGTDHNTFVIFPSTSSGLDEGVQPRKLQIDVLDAAGTSIAREITSLPINSSYVFDVRQALHGKVEITAAPNLYTVVAKGGSGSFAIVTFVINEKTGNMALEHSLSPHYYVSEGLPRVRADALSNFGS